MAARLGCAGSEFYMTVIGGLWAGAHHYENLSTAAEAYCAGSMNYEVPVGQANIAKQLFTGADAFTIGEGNIEMGTCRHCLEDHHLQSELRKQPAFHLPADFIEHNRWVHSIPVRLTYSPLHHILVFSMKNEYAFVSLAPVQKIPEPVSTALIRHQLQLIRQQQEVLLSGDISAPTCETIPLFERSRQRNVQTSFRSDQFRFRNAVCLRQGRVPLRNEGFQSRPSICFRDKEFRFQDKEFHCLGLQTPARRELTDWQVSCGFAGRSGYPGRCPQALFHFHSRSRFAGSRDVPLGNPIVQAEEWTARPDAQEDRLVLLCPAPD